MKVYPIENPLTGERVVAVFPPLAVRVVDASFRRRLNLYTGRTLSDAALQLEQQGRAGRLVMLAQTLSPGVVSGLEVDLERDPVSGHSFVHVAPGTGLTHGGEDVLITRALRIRADDLRVPAGSPGTSEDAEEPRIPAGTRLGVLVVQPALVRIAGKFDPDDPCDVDESADAFSDERTVDAAQIVLVPWKEEWATFAPGTDLRNRIAYSIFEIERSQDTLERHPWEVHGVPIALLAFEEAELEGQRVFRAAWVDGNAVARKGGKAKRRRQLVTTTDAATRGSPFLWQARMQQFAEQLAELGEFRGSLVNSHIARFARLPPAGMLPRDAIDLSDLTAPRNLFFPVNYRVQAAPLPLEQLDQVLARCASLAPFEVGVPDDVLVLAPVPQAAYEPRLLQREQVDPVFENSIAWFVFERDNLRLRRALVRRDHAALVSVTDGALSVTDYPIVDPEALEAEPDLPSPLPATASDYTPPKPAQPRPEGVPEPPVNYQPEERYGVVTAADAKLAVTAFTELRASLVKPGTQTGLVFSNQELSDLDTQGLAAFVASIASKLQRADDTLDFSFLKTHANIYRLRQFMLGNIAATRLASSPVLSSIAKGESAAAIAEEVNNFFLSVKGKTQPGTALDAVTRSVAAAPEAAVTRAASAFTQERVERAPSFPVFDLVVQNPRKVSIDPGGILREFPLEKADMPLRPKPKPKVVIQDAQPIAGEGAYDFRTVSVAQRIEDSPGRDSKNFAVAARLEALEAVQLLRSLHMNLDDIPVFGLVRLGKGVPLFYRKYLKPTRPAASTDADDPSEDTEFDTNDPGPDNARNMLNPRFGMAKRRSKPTLLKDLPDFSRVLTDPASLDADEGNLYSDAVLVLEHSIATLRAVEGRIASYRGELARCQQVLASINEVKEQAEKRLGVIDLDLSQARYRVTTARALLADESARVTQINDRRRAVLNEHLRFFAFVRPRFLEALVDAPLLRLNPGDFAPAVPACLNGHEDVPPQIEQMVQILREAPLRWFTHMPKLLDKLDRPDLLHGTILISQQRALTYRDPELLPSTFVERASVGKLGQSIRKVTMAQQRNVAALRMEVAKLDVTALAGLGWKESRERARRVVSVGDLIEANHGRSAVADAATQELAQIGRIAGCLHAQASDALPAIRFGWADRLSQYEDENVNLRNLAALPRWSEIDFIDRKEIEQLTDWLFGRIDADQPDALAWMNDLVRVCLLLASHAPVDEIIAGSLIEEVPQVSPGRSVPVAIDPGRVRVGMKVAFFKNQQLVAHGLVEDLVGAQAHTRIAEVESEVVFTKATRVQFFDPMARAAPNFARKKT